MLGLTHQNFLSAATGIVLAVALIRGFARASMKTIGNFWVDVTRCTLYILAADMHRLLRSSWSPGMPQTLGSYVEATTLEGAKQTIAVGPVASQVAIKMLGTKWWRFLQRQCGTSFREPDCSVELRADDLDLRDRGGLTNVFGRMVGNQRQGWAILAVMACCSSPVSSSVYWAEAHGNDALSAMGLTGATWRARKFASHRRLPPSLPSSRPRPRAVPSTPCTTRSPRWAA